MTCTSFHVQTNFMFLKMERKNLLVFKNTSVLSNSVLWVYVAFFLVHHMRKNILTKENVRIPGNRGKVKGTEGKNILKKEKWEYLETEAKLKGPKERTYWRKKMWEYLKTEAKLKGPKERTYWRKKSENTWKKIQS